MTFDTIAFAAKKTNSEQKHHWWLNNYNCY